MLIGRIRVPARCISTKLRPSGRPLRSATTGSRSTTRLQPCAEWAKRCATMNLQAEQIKQGASSTLSSTDPATDEVIWSGEVGDAAAEVAAARGAWVEWAAHSLSYRIETLRRFANVVRKKEAGFAEL